MKIKLFYLMIILVLAGIMIMRAYKKKADDLPAPSIHELFDATVDSIRLGTEIMLSINKF